jgi:putative tryptophan/tyrosine transport system substrate-binding protein
MKLIRLLGQARPPSIYMETGFVAAGGPISYGPNFTQLFRRAATCVDKILKGAKPADLINGNTAKTLGLVIPQSIPLRADEVIE